MLRCDGCIVRSHCFCVFKVFHMAVTLCSGFHSIVGRHISGTNDMDFGGAHGKFSFVGQGDMAQWVCCAYLVGLLFDRAGSVFTFDLEWKIGY